MLPRKAKSLSGAKVAGQLAPDSLTRLQLGRVRDVDLFCAKASANNALAYPSFLKICAKFIALPENASVVFGSN